MNVRSLVIPGILVVFSVTVIWVATHLDLSPPMIVGDGMQPRVFPIFLMVINLVLVAVLAVQLQRSPAGEKGRVRFPTWGSIVLLAVFYVLTIWLDMFIGIAVVMFLMCLLWGERRIWVAATVALATPASIFALFDLVLRIRFPRGLLTNWYYG